MSLAALAAFAVSNNNNRAPAGPRLFELSVEEARAKVIVSDGNKKPNEDGSQALVLKLGKYVLPLDVIAAGATRVNATKEQVEDFSAQLLAAVQAGAFDKEIVAAQAQAKVASETPRTKSAVVAKDTTVPEPTDELAEEPAGESEVEEGLDGLDLDSL